ncbi:MAG: hypothetical protein ACJ72W_06190 [Actinoallomurus sp.]
MTNRSAGKSSRAGRVPVLVSGGLRLRRHGARIAVGGGLVRPDGEDQPGDGDHSDDAARNAEAGGVPGFLAPV